MPSFLPTVALQGLQAPGEALVDGCACLPLAPASCRQGSFDFVLQMKSVARVALSGSDFFLFSSQNVLFSLL